MLRLAFAHAAPGKIKLLQAIERGSIQCELQNSKCCVPCWQKWAVQRDNTRCSAAYLRGLRWNLQYKVGKRRNKRAVLGGVEREDSEIKWISYFRPFHLAHHWADIKQILVQHIIQSKFWSPLLMFKGTRPGRVGGLRLDSGFKGFLIVQLNERLLMGK